MSGVLITIGVLLCLAGLWAVFWPKRLLNLVRRVTISTSLRLIAFLVRVILGVLLIIVAPSTGFALALRVIGTLLIVSGVAVLAIGNEWVQRIFNWALRKGPAAVIAGGLAGLIFGGFLIYVGY